MCPPVRGRLKSATWPELVVSGRTKSETAPERRCAPIGDGAPIPGGTAVYDRRFTLATDLSWNFLSDGPTPLLYHYPSIWSSPWQAPVSIRVQATNAAGGREGATRRSQSRRSRGLSNVSSPDHYLGLVRARKSHAPLARDLLAPLAGDAAAVRSQPRRFALG